MQCQQCATENPTGSAFCQECGTKLGITCAACGRSSGPLARFCGWCGASLTREHQVSEPVGERKQATVLFADIVGSTELIADLDAEQAMDRLQPVVAAMGRAVRRFGGTIVRTLGDGLKAAFGAPVAREGHALLACQAALAMRDAVAALAYAPTIRVGLHSGEVVAGTLNTGAAVELEAQGMTVHLASRIEQMADANDIIMSGACRALVGPYCETEALGQRSLRGVPLPIELYRLTGLRPAVASDQFRGGDLARFRGRAAELAVLQQALIAAEGGTASVIGISAPAGLGKSRLCFEFSEWCRQRRVEVVEGRAHVFGQATPLLPVLEMLRTFLRITPNMAPVIARERIGQRLRAMGLEVAGDLAILLDFLGIPDPDQATPHLDPAGRSARLRGFVRAMIKAAGQRPSVILVEDMHWLDDASGAFMETLVEAVEGTHTVVVFNYRPSWTGGPTDCPYFQEIRLTELPEPDANGLISELVGPDPALRRIIASVSAQSTGNPFFAEQLVLSLAQGGTLVGERGAYRLSAAAPSDVALPATIEAVIGARLDALRDREKNVLQIGAILGKEFPLALIERISNAQPEEVRQLLARLCEAGLLQVRTLASGSGYAFGHPLIQEVAYATQLRSRRTRLHAAVASAMEEQEWGRADEFAGLLAYHCEAAGQLETAAMHLQRAARWVGRTNAAQALADWKKVRWLLRDQPRSDENDKLRALASGQILNFGWREGMSAEEAEPFAEEALRYARERGDRLHEPLLLGAYGRILAIHRSADDYVRLVREAMAVAEADDDPARSATLRGMLGQALFLAGLLPEALAVNDAALAGFAAQRQTDGQVLLGLNVNQVLGFDIEHWIRCTRGSLLLWLGRFEEAEDWLARTIQVPADLIVPLVQFIPHFALTELAWHRGDGAAATRHAAAVWELAEQSATPYLLVQGLCCRGMAASADGRYAVAEEHFTAALTAARTTRSGLEFEARLLAKLADTHLRSGDIVAAGTVAAEAIAVARRRGDRLAECHAGIIAGAARTRAQDAAVWLVDTEKLLITIGAELLRPLLERVRKPIDPIERLRL